VDEGDDGVFEKGSGVALNVGLEVVEDPAGVGVPEAFEGAMGIVVII